jgi:hypothetical protein
MKSSRPGVARAATLANDSWGSERVTCVQIRIRKQIGDPVIIINICPDIPLILGPNIGLKGNSQGAVMELRRTFHLEEAFNQIRLRPQICKMRGAVLPLHFLKIRRWDLRLTYCEGMKRKRWKKITRDRKDGYSLSTRDMKDAAALRRLGQLVQNKVLYW